jgi:predicted ATPase
MAEQVARIVSEWRAEYKDLRTGQEKNKLIERIQFDVNEQLQSLYESGVFNFEVYDDDAHKDDDGLIWENYQSEVSDSFMRRVDSADAQQLKDLVLVDIRKSTPVTHRDVGIGISQVLPVLVMAYGSRDKLLAMEQPEIHLHPALQAELGDVFIESALGERKNTFILETHSEHMILRLMRRIREGKLSPDDVGVIFVEPHSQGSRFVELQIDEEGDFIDEWPGGFFEESFHEKFAGR